MFYGIDLSDHNSTAGIDWDVVAKSKSFVMLRLGWANENGTITVDKDFDKKYKGALKAGLSIGIYVYSYLKSEAKARDSAQNVDRIIRDKSLYLTHPIAFDIEEHKLYSKLSRSTNTDICKGFLSEIQSLGYYAMLYTYTSFMFSYLSVEELKGYSLWVADYRNPKATNCPYNGEWAMWQYKGDTGRCTGVSGACDLNLTPIDFARVIKDRELNNVKSAQAQSSAVTQENNDLQTSYISKYSLVKDGEKILSRHFKVKEFGSPYSDVILIDSRLIYILERLFSDLSMSKLVITSGYRTNEHSVKVKGYSGDMHTKGQACDFIGYKDNKKISAKEICCKLQEYGDVFGIGYISEYSTHVDTRTKNTVWFGDETTGVSLLKKGYNSFNEYWGTDTKKLTIKLGVWNVRSEPSLNSGVVAIISGGFSYDYTEVKNNWYYLPKHKGWISGTGVILK